MKLFKKLFCELWRHKFQITGVTYEQGHPIFAITTHCTRCSQKGYFRFKDGEYKLYLINSDKWKHL